MPPTRASVALQFSAFAEEVRAVLAPALADAHARAAERAKQAGPVGATLSHVTGELTARGGKRMRAVLVALGYRVAGASADLSPIVPALVAIELLQTYLLIHDDWMDGDDMRRGGPSVPAMLREEFGQRGDAASILAGDLVSALAHAELLNCKVAPARVLEAARAFSRMLEDVVLGQSLDVLEQANVDDIQAHVERVHLLKTASYTTTGPLIVGACLAGADRGLLSALEGVGRPLGIAFQMRDDVLGSFGNPEDTGKSTTGDLLAGKPTALVCELAATAGGVDIAKNILSGSLAPDSVAFAKAKLVEHGCVERVEAKIEACVQESREQVTNLATNEASRGILLGAIEALGARAL